MRNLLIGALLYMGCGSDSSKETSPMDELKKEAKKEKAEKKRVIIESSKGVQIPEKWVGTYTNKAFKDNEDLEWSRVYLSSTAITGKLFHTSGLVSLKTVTNVRGTVKDGVYKWEGDDECSGTLEKSGKSNLILNITCKNYSGYDYRKGKDSTVNVELIASSSRKKIANTKEGSLDPLSRNIEGDSLIPEKFRSTWSNEAYIDNDSTEWKDIIIASNSITGKIFHAGGLVSTLTLSNFKGKEEGNQYHWTTENGCDGVFDYISSQDVLLTFNCPHKVISSYEDDDQGIVVRGVKGKVAKSSLKATKKKSKVAKKSSSSSSSKRKSSKKRKSSGGCSRSKQKKYANYCK